MNEVVRGGLAGALATAPMTLVMTMLHRKLPEPEQYPLPPKEITAELAEEIGVEPYLEEEELNALTLMAHLGYGAAMGVLYAPLSRQVKAPLLVKGAAFGLTVWTASYLGLMPVLGILKPASKHPPRRNALMIAAHLVYGSALAFTEERFRRNA